MLEKFDVFTAGVLHVPLKFLCKLTGRSNYFFAITTMILSGLLNTIYFANRVSIGKLTIVDGVLIPIQIIFSIFMIIFFRIDQKKVNSGSDSINLSEFNSPNWTFIRSLLVCMDIITIPMNSLSGDLYGVVACTASLLWAVAVYFAADTTPRGKGWLQKVTSRIITGAKKPVKLPSLNPSPPPIPT